jgi:uncharacterized membrane protein YphA (DoxX/SURF4 family)
VNLKERTYLWYLAVLRIYVGYYLFFQGVGKFQHNFAKGDWIGRYIGDVASLDLYPWYKAFLQRYVVPHSELFGNLVMCGEIAVGVCLLFGLFTRISALVGLAMLVNYYLGPGTARGGYMLAHQQFYIIALALFVLAGPGRTLGVDGLLFRSVNTKGKGSK